MHRRLPQIIPVRRQGRFRHTARQHIAPVRRIVHRRVLDRRARGPRVRHVRRQRAVAQQGGRGGVGVGWAREVGLEIDVEGGVGAAAEGLLHGGGGGVGGPGVVDGPGCGDEAKAYAGGAVEGGEDGDLGVG